MKFQKKVRVKGHGEYTIEITNLVNSKTLQSRPALPSLMDSANFEACHDKG
jgi:hypothetical protein